ncbi:Hypothetical predicted protein [Mytilus galloprovincialis]|uniref:Mab-21-like HhH/H2TH-like domain-containing protein n=1 Tax=Mytilus galloprovincialis TaxID=29158 RepID=A0A8B6E819_MYTGA|nr:Hypothetical predicted protein [Mytilus galloprovincialis]
MNAVRDSLTSNKIYTNITSGSFGEGLEMRGSDFDMMHVDKSIDVYDKKPPFKPNITYLSMDTDDIKPCYSLLRLEHIGDQYDHFQICDELNGEYYLSSTLYKHSFLSSYLSKIHGPCVTNETGLLDHAFSLHCKNWIAPAFHWITRSSNAWPSHNVKQSIVDHGVLFVPIGVKGSSKEHLEWRISFSVGEKFLINTFTHTQLLCYALMKILIKDVLSTYSECKDLLCSYFLKTIIFWISEELPLSVWKRENLIPSFMRCLNRLIYSVEYSVCLHYFIPENNMFENKIEGRPRKILLEKLSNLHSYGWQCILFSDQIFNFNVSKMDFHIESHTLYALLVDKTIRSGLMCLANNLSTTTAEDWSVFKRGIQHIASFDKSSIKYLFAYYMSRLRSLNAQYLPQNIEHSNNKCNYKQYKTCLCTLLQNIYHDAVSGWLMLASLFYTKKRYTDAIQIIRYSFAKFTPEKLYHMMYMSDVFYPMIKLKSIRKKCIVNLWKYFLIEYIHFTKNSILIPDEILLEVETGMLLLPSPAYAYFLNFLCHFHLNNVRQCKFSLHSLQMVIEENYFIATVEGKAQAFNVLGVAFQLFGDTESAREAFLHSVDLKPGHLDNTAIKRLMFML